jgi:hypothetical protein
MYSLAIVKSYNNTSNFRQHLTKDCRRIIYNSPQLCMHWNENKSLIKYICSMTWFDDHFQEINQTMNEYVRLRSQQFANLVKRYIEHRKVIEIQRKLHRNINVYLLCSYVFSRSYSKWNIGQWSKTSHGKDGFLLSTSQFKKRDAFSSSIMFIVVSYIV